MKNKIFVENSCIPTIEMFIKWGFEIVHKPEESDMLVFTGGTDVDPTLYGEAPGEFTQRADYVRDKVCEDLYWEVSGKYALPCVGICRGAQFITVMQGGKLKQHITNHNDYIHDVVFEDGSVMSVTSDHHQEMVPDDYVSVIGTAPDGTVEITLNHLSTTVHDLCVQGHPEWVDETHPFQIWFINQVKEMLK